MVTSEGAHHRRSIRLPAFDYSSSGAYFVTMVTHGRAALFGGIVEGMMRRNDAGEMVGAMWQCLPGRFPAVEIGDFVVMPNHFHAIIVLHAKVGAALVAARESNLPENRAGTRPAPTAPTLGAIVGAFKSLVTRRHMIGVREEGWPAFHRQLWQRNYYEHIIRDEADWDRIRRYIEANPMNWDEDEENPVSTRT
jgi:putative transposase